MWLSSYIPLLLMCIMMKVYHSAAQSLISVIRKGLKPVRKRTELHISCIHFFLAVLVPLRNKTNSQTN